MRRALLRLLNVFRRAAPERELERELASHLALLEDEYRRRGLTPDDARLAARRAFGFGHPPWDPLIFGGAAALFAVVALAACYGPAQRVTQIDPLSALRYE